MTFVSLPLIDGRVLAVNPEQVCFLESIAPSSTQRIIVSGWEGEVTVVGCVSGSHWVKGDCFGVRAVLCGGATLDSGPCDRDPEASDQ